MAGASALLHARLGLRHSTLEPHQRQAGFARIGPQDRVRRRPRFRYQPKGAVSLAVVAVPFGGSTAFHGKRDLDRAQDDPEALLEYRAGCGIPTGAVE